MPKNNPDTTLNPEMNSCLSSDGESSILQAASWNLPTMKGPSLTALVHREMDLPLFW